MHNYASEVFIPPFDYTVEQFSVTRLASLITKGHELFSINSQPVSSNYDGNDKCTRRENVKAGQLGGGQARNSTGNVPQSWFWNCLEIPEENVEMSIMTQGHSKKESLKYERIQSPFSFPKKLADRWIIKEATQTYTARHNYFLLNVSSCLWIACWFICGRGEWFTWS